jgi:hypothetical protein
MAKKKASFNQSALTGAFADIQYLQLFLYNVKNVKYEDSFNRNTKKFGDAMFNLTRKYDRLKYFEKRFKKGLKPKEMEKLLKDVWLELIDLSNYSIMSMMKFRPKQFKTIGGFLDFLKDE